MKDNLARGTGSEHSQLKANLCNNHASKGYRLRHSPPRPKIRSQGTSSFRVPGRNPAPGRRRRGERTAQARADPAHPPRAARPRSARGPGALPFRAPGPSPAPRERPRGGAKIDPTNSYKLERERRQSGEARSTSPLPEPPGRPPLPPPRGANKRRPRNKGGVPPAPAAPTPRPPLPCWH